MKAVLGYCLIGGIFIGLAVAGFVYWAYLAVGSFFNYSHHSVSPKPIPRPSLPGKRTRNVASLSPRPSSRSPFWGRWLRGI